MKHVIHVIVCVVLLMTAKVNAQQQEMYTFCTGSSYAYLLDTSSSSTSNYYARWNIGQTPYTAHFLKDTIYQGYGMGSGTGGYASVKKWACSSTTAATCVWTYTASNMHHDICPMPNGNVLVLVRETKTAAQVQAVGGNVTSGTYYFDIIREIKPTGTTSGTVVWEWKLFNHLCQSYNSSYPDYYSNVANCPQRWNVNCNLTTDGFHPNGVDYNPTLDQIVFSSHNQDEIFVIDHSTTTAEAATSSGGNAGKGGDFLYRWGKPQNYNCTSNGNGITLNVVHDARWVPSNNADYPNYISFFHNGGCSSGKACVLHLPPYNGYNYTYTVGQVIGPTTCVTPTTPSFSAGSMGGCSALENGNILVTNPNTRFYECNGSGTTFQNVTVGTVQSDRLKKCEVLGPFVTATALPTTVCAGSTVSLTSAASAPMQTSPSYTYSWTSAPSGFTSGIQNPTVTPAAAGTYTYTVAVSSGGCTGTASVKVVVNSATAAASVSIAANPGSSICSGTSVSFTATPTNGGTSPTYQWKKGGTSISGATNSTYTSASLSNGDIITCNMTSNLSCVSGSPATSNSVTMAVTMLPTAEAGTDATFNGTPIMIGDPASGPGTFSWLPTAGLSDPGIAQPSASPSFTTVYTLTVNNNGCTATDDVTITVGVIAHTISGKTRYLNKAISGNPVPNPPSYDAAIYNIDNAEVKLKTNPGGTVLATTMSDANGTYQFTNVPDGNYILSYDHIPYDTMQYVNQVNAIDLALLKYLIGHDTLTDPSRSFTAKHKKAADVDNNTTINTIDIARISAKVGLPYTPSRNFPKGNWVALDTSVTVAGADLTITLRSIAYGDYDASSTRYKDSLTNWGTAKVLPDENIIIRSDESIIMNDPEYFEVPLRISTKMNELAAVGLELSYPSDKFKLVSASMSNTGKNGGAIKINPTLEEIIAANNDLLVTDDQGIIRVVYATTDHFDIAANDELVRLGFVSLNDPGRGELDFDLNGTGLIANQYGEINSDAYLTMPKIFVQGNNTEAGYEFAGYPNPFSGDVVFSYHVPEEGTTSIKIFNALGTEVYCMSKGSQPSGTHSVTVSGKDLPTGMYTVKFEFSGAGKTEFSVLKMIRQ